MVKPQGKDREVKLYCISIKSAEASWLNKHISDWNISRPAGWRDGKALSQYALSKNHPLRGAAQ